MKLRIIVVLLAASFSYACSMNTPKVVQTAHDFWNDKVFDYNEQDVVETKDMLFALDPELTATLNAKSHKYLGSDRRVEYLSSMLFSPEGIRINYATGHSTSANETWQKKRGDCLSLTLLTYAVSKALGIEASMQEVRVPVAVDRRGGVDFVSGHVNVVVDNTSTLRINGRSFSPGGVVIDFEPQIGSRQQGTRLTDDEIVARFYNNRATEHLSAKSYSKAYAYYKAAIIADPYFSSAYSNLALLYSQSGLESAAEGLLNHAILLNDRSDAPLRTLHKLLTAQGRTSEAAEVAVKLRKHDDEDPYYWVGIGLDHLRQNRLSKAIDALERAERLTSGFDEVHRYLAIAYWRNGQQKQADRQLSVLAAMLAGDPGVAKLSAKLNRSPGEVSLQ